jgi:hypothetical protein
MTLLQTTFLLLVIFQIKHFAADFPLQMSYMLRKVSSGWDFFVPLATHCSVHMVLTFLICLVFAPSLWFLALADFAIHFTMDRIKSGPRYLGRFNDISKSSYWISLGFDQMVHHLTHIWIIYLILRERFPDI